MRDSLKVYRQSLCPSTASWLSAKKKTDNAIPNALCQYIYQVNSYIRPVLKISSAGFLFQVKTGEWNMIQMKCDTQMFLIKCLALSSPFIEMPDSRYNALGDGSM